MRIRMIQTLSTSRQTFVNGREYDVTDVDGAAWVKAKLAADVTPKPAPAKPEAKKPEAKKPEAKPAEPKGK